MSDANQWKRCSSCKTPIAFTAKHWVCNVSTCNRPRTGLAFCTVSCWEAHVPVMRHRESWALEKEAPTRDAWLHEQRTAAGGVAPPSRTSGPVPSPSGRPGVLTSVASRPALSMSSSAPALSREVLVVTSKFKAYVKARSGMSTSDGVVDPLSDWLRALADEAMRNAERDGRKTVLDRDIPKRSRS